MRICLIRGKNISYGFPTVNLKVIDISRESEDATKSDYLLTGTPKQYWHIAAVPTLIVDRFRCVRVRTKEQEKPGANARLTANFQTAQSPGPSPFSAQFVAAAGDRL